MEVLNNGVWIAIIAHAIIGASLVWDKVLLAQPATKSVVNYVFWLGAMSILGLCLIPFGFRMPGIPIAALAFASGVIHLAANYFYYAALQHGQASQTLAIMGGFSPLATALVAIGLLDEPLGKHGALGFALLVGGGFVMFLSEKLNLRKMLPRILLASGLFGLTNVTQKMAFDLTNFVSAYVFFTLGTVAGALLFLLRRCWREEIFRQSESATPKSRSWYFVNRFLSGVGSFLIFFAISRANPSIVDAISGLRYVIIFLGALWITKWKPIWLKENFNRRSLTFKISGTFLIVAGLVMIGLEGEGTALNARVTSPAR